LFGVLRAKNGKLDLGKIGIPPDRLVNPKRVPIDPVDAPDWYRDTYGIEHALTNSSEANDSPNFPVVGQVLLRQWEAVRGEALDGLIALDPMALQDAMRGLEPIKVPGLRALDAENAKEVLAKDSYTEFGENRQDKVLGLLLTKFWHRLSAGAVDSTELARGLTEAVGTQDLKIFSRDPQTQRSMVDMGAAGDYTAYGPNVQIVWHNSRSVSKVDYFMHRKQQTIIDLDSSDRARVTTTAEMHNLAPKGPPSNLIGSLRPGYTVGENRMDFDMLLPSGAQVARVTQFGDEIPTEAGRETSYPVVLQRFQIGPKKTAITSVSYEMDGPQEASDGPRTFTFTLMPQPMVNPDTFQLVFRSETEKMKLAGSDDSPRSILTIDGVLDRPTTVTIEVSD
jgi:hypothetical protein